jgi:Uma2 family endonuclease
MSTATNQPGVAAPPSLEVPGPNTRVPSLEELKRLTEVPDRRVVFRGVDWSFYDRLVDSIPEGSNIHVDYDGKDLEVMGKGQKHDLVKKLLGRIVDVLAEEYEIPFAGYGEATWKRPELARGLEADEAYYFRPKKLEAAAEASSRDSQHAADYPNPDLAIEVDPSRPAVDRAGIYAALQVAEVWRWSGRTVVIERLTAEGNYAASDTSGWLPVTIDDIERWLADAETKDQSAWLRKLRAVIKTARLTTDNEQRTTDLGQRTGRIDHVA